VGGAAAVLYRGEEGKEVTWRKAGLVRGMNVGEGDLVVGRDAVPVPEGSGNPERSRNGELVVSRTVLLAVPMEELLGRVTLTPSPSASVSCAIKSGLATLRLIAPSSIWLTSELALDFRRPRPGASISGSGTSPSPSMSTPPSEDASVREGGQEILMSSVKSERMEKREERVPPVETSFRR
jgi:hypothetical protein